MNHVLCVIVAVALAGCSLAPPPPVDRTQSPYVDALKDASKASRSADAVLQTRENAINSAGN